MKLATKYLLALITTVLLLNLSVAEARRTSGMAALANIGPAGPTGPAGARGATGTSAPVHAIGENYQGGIIFWVDADGQHGLIASNVILGSGVTWYDGYVVSPYQYLNTGATGDGIYAGIGNTANLVAQQNAMSAQASIAAAMGTPPVPILKLVSSAAQMANDYSVQDDGTTACTGASTETCWGDWYLPSKFELNLLYNQKESFPLVLSIDYWSSTGSSCDGIRGCGFQISLGQFIPIIVAEMQHMGSGQQHQQDQGSLGMVVPVRAF
jgi:hypothetical protein